MSLVAQHLTILTGASSGMGLAMARHLLSPQRVLLCISRRLSPDLEALARLRGATLVQWSQDLGEPTGAGVRLDAWLDKLVPADLSSATLINNAGVIPRIGPLQDCPASEVTNALRVGLEAPMLLTAAFLRATDQWVAAGWSAPRKVLNISSGLGRHAMAAQAPYCAAKAGLDHFTRCCALEQAQKPNGAQLVALAPGVIDTEMQEQLRSSEPAQFPDLSRFTAMHEKGQLASPDEAAARVLAYLERADFGSQPVADVRD